VGNFISDIVEGAKDVVSDIGNSIVDFISPVWSASVDFFTGTVKNLLGIQDYDIPEIINEHRVQKTLDPDYNIPVIYGETEVAGNVVFYDVSGENNKYLDIVVAVCEGEIEGFSHLYMNDEPIPLIETSGVFTPATKYTATHPLYGATYASGNLTIKKIIEGYKIRFQDGSHSGTYTIPSGATLSSIVADLNSSNNPIISKATYSVNGNSIGIKYKTLGSAGNNFAVSYQTNICLASGDDGSCSFYVATSSTRLSGGRDVSYAEAFFYNGTEDQVVNSQLYSAHPSYDFEILDSQKKFKGVTVDHRFRGIAYVYIRLTHNADLFAGGMPNFKFKLKGKKVYDPRTSTITYSANPAICLRDYILSTRYGKGLDPNALSDASIISAANDCDTVRSGLSVEGTPVEYKSYEIGAIVDTGKPVKDNVKLFLQSMNAVMPYYDGVFYVKVLKAGEPVITFSEDNIIGAVSVNSPDKNNRFNKVLISFPDRQRHYKIGEAPIDRTNSTLAATYYDDDNNQVLEKRITAPYVDYYPRARDLAELTMNLSRAAMGVSFTTTLEALKVVPGDIVGVDYEVFGWVGKEFRLDKITIRPDGLCDVSLIEHSDSFYTLTEKQEQDTPSDPKLQLPSIVTPPTDLTLISDKTTHFVNIDGLVKPRILCSWVSVDAYALEHHIFIKKSLDTDFTKVGQVNDTDALSFYIDNVEWGVSYDVGIKTVNGLGYNSILTNGTIIVPNPLTEAIYDFPDVSGLELAGVGTQIGKGNDTEFTGKDIKLQWRLSSSNVTFEFGSIASEQMGGVGGVSPFTLKGYRVEVYHPNDTDPRQEYFVTQPNFVYPLDKNIEDGNGTPSRTVTFKVYAVGQVAGTGISGESETPAKITVENPQPSLPTGLNISAAFQTITVKFNRPNDADFKGVMVWMGSSSGFERDETTLVYDGPDNDIVLTGLESGTDYYLRLAAYDDFGKTGITESSEYHVTTQKIISADLDDTPPSTPGVPLLTTGVEDNTLSTLSYVKATWDASTDDGILSGYIVRYWTTTEADASEIFTTNNTEVLHGLKPGLTCYVKVRALDWASNESDWTVTSSVVVAGDTSAPGNVTGATITAGLDKVIIRWTNPTDVDFLDTLVYIGTTSGFTADATSLKYKGRGNELVYAEVTNGDSYYAKFQTVDASGNISAVSTAIGPVIPTKITVSNVTSYVEDGAIQASQIADATLPTAKFASSIEPVTIVSSIPSIKSTNTVFNTADGKLYRWDGSAYVATILTSDLNGTISDAQIAGMEASKVTGQLSDSQLAAIAAAKITGTIATDQITDSAITATKFANNIEPVTVVSSIPSTKSTSTIFNTSDDKLYRWDGSSYVATVPTTDLVGTVSSSQVEDSAITAVKIAAAAVTAQKLSINKHLIY